jgi:hypothetical protein
VPWKDGFVAAHEFGHVLHRHSWGGSFGANYDYGDDSEGWHSWTSAEWQEATFIEGFAEFVSASAFFGPSASAPKYRGNSMSDAPNGGADPVCVVTTLPGGTGPERNEGNVARYFWDLFDSVNDDAYVDSLALSSSMIFTKLYSFPSGTANRQRSESDTDGPNAKDYYYHLLYTGSPLYGSVDNVYSNCLEDCDWN